MPITAMRDDLRRRVVATVTGVLTVDEVIAFLREYRAGSPRSYSLLVDLRVATAMPPADALRACARWLAELSRVDARGRAALVAHGPAIYAAARVFEQGCADAGMTTVRACRSIDEAEGWFVGRR